MRSPYVDQRLEQIIMEQNKPKERGFGIRNCEYCKQPFLATTKAHRYCSKQHANADARGSIYSGEAVPAVEEQKPPKEKPKLPEYRLEGGMTDDEREAYRLEMRERVLQARNRVHAYFMGHGPSV